MKQRGKYQNLEVRLLKDIIAATWLKNNDYFNSEYKLSRKYGVTRMTVRKALAGMENTGVIYKLPQRGIFINNAANAGLRLEQIKNNGIQAFIKTRKETVRVFSLFKMPEDDFRAGYESAVYFALKQACDEAGCDLTISSGSTIEDVLKVGSIMEFQRDGLIWIAPPAEAEKAMIKLSEKGIKVIVMGGRFKDRRINFVDSDNIGGMFKAVGYLAGLGHKKIAFLGAGFKYPNTMDRLEGYKRALGKNKLTFDQALVLNYTTEGYEGYAARVSHMASPPTAVVTINQHIAVDFIAKAGKAGLKVPEDVSIIGYDDAPYLAHLRVPLTTMRQPIEKMALLAVQKMLDLRNGNIKGPVRINRLKQELIIRNSARNCKSPSRVKCPLNRQIDSIFHG